MSSLSGVIMALPSIHLISSEIIKPLLYGRIATIYKKMITAALAIVFSTYLCSKIETKKDDRYDQMLIVFAPITLSLLRKSNRKLIVVEALLTLTQFGYNFKNRHFSRDDLIPIAKVAICGVSAASLFHFMNQYSLRSTLIGAFKVFHSIIFQNRT
ncbi:MAG: hypothetical protein P0S95_04040 [Rhabdochlamydiaceae bacterium]|nr:hypothetical protein [Candidatus Amphrikana amoebophyrae]